MYQNTGTGVSKFMIGVSESVFTTSEFEFTVSEFTLSTSESVFFMTQFNGTISDCKREQIGDRVVRMMELVSKPGLTCSE